MSTMSYPVLKKGFQSVYVLGLMTKVLIDDSTPYCHDLKDVYNSQSFVRISKPRQ